MQQDPRLWSPKLAKRNVNIPSSSQISSSSRHMQTSSSSSYAMAQTGPANRISSSSPTVSRLAAASQSSRSAEQLNGSPQTCRLARYALAEQGRRALPLLPSARSPRSASSSSFLPAEVPPFPEPLQPAKVHPVLDSRQVLHAPRNLGHQTTQGLIRPSQESTSRGHGSYCTTVERRTGGSNTPARSSSTTTPDSHIERHTNLTCSPRTRSLRDAQIEPEPAPVEFSEPTLLRTPNRNGELWENVCTHLSPIESVSEMSRSMNTFGNTTTQALEGETSQDSTSLSEDNTPTMNEEPPAGGISTRASHNPANEVIEQWCERERLPDVVCQRLIDEAIRSPRLLTVLNRQLLEQVVKDLQIGVQAQFFDAVDSVRIKMGLPRLFAT